MARNDSKRTNRTAAIAAAYGVSVKQEKCAHSWIAGMIYVDPEDLARVIRSRRMADQSPPRCESCGLGAVKFLGGDL
jgi:hypothetical protein